MTAAFKKSVIRLLGLSARAVIRKYQPQVLMVTGSVGKTSTKDAVAAALSGSREVRKSEKSFNSEIGVPLTILGAKNPWSNPLKWLGVFLRAFRLLLLPYTYPSQLVLEVGADHPGDLAGILHIVRPHAVVVTLLPEIPVHVEMYASPEDVRAEEFTPAKALPTGAPLIISADDPFARELANATTATITTFGYAEGADVQITDLAVLQEEGKPIGMQAVLRLQGTQIPVSIRGSFGRSQLYAPAATYATAFALGSSIEDATKGFASYVSPPGRARLFRGIHDSLLIDDSYNASPVAVEEVLRSLPLLNATRTIGVLGDMRELGKFSQEEHVRIGKIAAETLQVLCTVGEAAKGIAEGARDADMDPERIYECATAQEAAQLMPSLAQKGDVMLVKGSQGIRLEQVVGAVIADQKDREGMVRQDAAWKHR